MLKMWTSSGLLVLGAVVLASGVTGSPVQRRFSPPIEDESYTCGTRPLEDYPSDWHTQGIVTKILGGHDAEHGSIPWQANLLGNKIHSCGGTILSEYWILTAAHCYYKKLNYHIVVGDVDQLEDEDEDEKFQVDKFIIHKDYFLNQSGNYLDRIINDIALIKIKPKNGRGFQFNEYVQPACLPYSHSKPEPHQKYIVSGWGYTSPGEISNVLQVTQVALRDGRKFCPSKTYYPDTMLCSHAGKRNTCQGDSGGPLVANFNGVYQVFGVTSFGTSICKAPKLSYFTKVQAYLGWIKSTIRHNSGNEEEKFLPSRPNNRWIM